MLSIGRLCMTRLANSPGQQSPVHTTRRNVRARKRRRASRKSEVESPPLGGHRRGRSVEIVRRPPGVPRRLLHGRARRFFFTDPATPEIYTLSLHDALPI